ncbi:energy-coupling factor transporter transmembrane component T [Ferrimicrobium sp.]|uniref:energy-coupling factor transporter transmembrane component T n=1 Tax=Ferrimicrobium sp. TaxID=2926050 RepID=UPI002615B985|nr:energy-coupling factor transporter transmembrane component T [Ferrimicrobium sp.]
MALLVWTLGALLVVLAIPDPLSATLVTVVSWIVLVKRRVSERQLRPLVVGLAIMGFVSMLVNGVLVHEGATVVGFVPTWIPLVSGPITIEGFLQGGSIALTLIATISAAATLAVVMDPTDLADSFPRSLSRVGAALGSALNLAPAMAASYRSIKEAQQFRGWRPRGARAMIDIIIPVLLGAIERSTQLAESMEARGFGSGPRSQLVAQEPTIRNLTGAVLVAMCGFPILAVHLAHVPVLWYPYPTPSMPSLSPLVWAPSVLLWVAALVIEPG